MTEKILVVDDEPGIRDLMQELLKEVGYEVAAAKDGKDGLRAFFAGPPSLVLLDIMMPEMDGWNLLERIREVSEAPVIIVTALGREREKVRGLRAGADDYVVKPFPRAEFLARVEAALRKTKQQEKPTARYEDPALVVDFTRHQVYLRGDEIDLTPQEFRLLSALIRNANLVLSVDQILDHCWGNGLGGSENVRVYIGYLRKKLEDDPGSPQLIETVREFGYRYRQPTQ